MLTAVELRRATTDAARRLGKAGGAEVRAEGTTLLRAFAGGTEVVLRNRLAPDAAFDRELLLDNIATALLSAEGTRE